MPRHNRNSTAHPSVNSMPITNQGNRIWANISHQEGEFVGVLWDEAPQHTHNTPFSGIEFTQTG